MNGEAARSQALLPSDAVLDPGSSARLGAAPRKKRSTEGMVQVVIMLVIGGAAGAGSFKHVHDVVAAHGQAGWLAWADAVLELMSIAVVLSISQVVVAIIIVLALALALPARTTRYDGERG
jgi:hypothetical protein